jgi:hypothetical protein
VSNHPIRRELIFNPEHDTICFTACPYTHMPKVPDPWIFLSSVDTSDLPHRAFVPDYILLTTECEDGVHALTLVRGRAVASLCVALHQPGFGFEAAPIQYPPGRQAEARLPLRPPVPAPLGVALHGAGIYGSRAGLVAAAAPSAPQ